MSLDYVDLGSTPCAEECEQVGPNFDPQRARHECAVYKKQLVRQFGECPGTRLSIKNNPHDFGAYPSVVCYFSDKNEEAMRYAYKMESEAPVRWDATALDELELLGVKR